MSPTLATAFVDACPPQSRAAASTDSDLPKLLETLCERAAAAWPELPPPELSFARHLGERCTAAVFAQGVETLHVEDLHLARLCAAGHPRALSLFEARMLRPAVKASDEEVKARVREKLFAGPRPKIGDYAGRGPLLAWLAMIVRREAIDLSRTGPKGEAEATPSLADVLASDPELKAARDQAKDALAAALNAAIGELEVRDRRLLRLFHLDGLAHGQIGQSLGIPRSTVAHRLGKARAELLSRARAHLKAQLRLGDSEIDSLIGLARSHLDLSLSLLQRD